MIRTSGTKIKVGLTLGAIVVAFSVLFVGFSYPIASNIGYAPVQPIPFSHKLHSGENKIPCLYCHSSAEKSKHSTVPSLGICMNCHKVVQVKSPYIQQVKKAYDEGKPIEWIRVHELADHAYFPHKNHVAKGIACQVCHGNVEAMERIEQKSSLTMGWCMECHRGQTAPHAILAKTYPKMKHPQGPVAPVQCNTCHK